MHQLTLAEISRTAFKRHDRKYSSFGYLTSNDPNTMCRYCYNENTDVVRDIAELVLFEQFYEKHKLQPPPPLPKKFIINKVTYVPPLKLDECIIAIDMKIFDIIQYLKLGFNRVDDIRHRVMLYASITYEGANIIFEYDTSHNKFCDISVDKKNMNKLIEFIYDYGLEDKIIKHQFYIEAEKIYKETL